MAQAIIFDPHSAPIPNRVKQYLRSVEAAEYAGRSDVILYDTPGDPPDVAGLISLQQPLAFWKVVGGVVTQLTQADLDLIAQAQANAEAQAAQLALIDLKQEAIAYLSADRTALQRTFKAAIETVIELTVSQINVLRAQHGLSAITASQVKSAFQSTYQDKINAIT